MFISDRARRRWRQSENTAQSTRATRRSFPTNRIRDAVYTRRRLKWGVPAMLLAAPYVAAVKPLSDFIDYAGPEWGWLHLVVLLCAWNALKMLWLGPMSLIALARARHREHIYARAARRRATSAGPADADLALVGGASLTRSSTGAARPSISSGWTIKTPAAARTHTSTR